MMEHFAIQLEYFISVQECLGLEHAIVMQRRHTLYAEHVEDLYIL